ncbi:MAG: phytoene desaturase family protein [Burkholderiales bacterium]|nr:phytoene desaturase family protein [Burkholderiales bacterium]
MTDAATPPARTARHAVVIGAGMGGLAAAISLRAAGWAVTVVERQGNPGGKLRAIDVGGQALDAGPTVLTLLPVIERLFSLAGTRAGSHIDLERLTTLARHYWPDGSCLDLFADAAANEAAIEQFSGPGEVDRFRRFHTHARQVHDTLRTSFMEASRPNPILLAWRIGLHRPGALLGISPFERYWQALAKRFNDPRLRQLYGRYATYVGASPFASPATLMLIAHVEQLGVWRIPGGLHALARVLADLSERQGARWHLNERVVGLDPVADGWRVRAASGRRWVAQAVVSNADVSAFAAGEFGDAARAAVPPTPRASRSLSAITVNGLFSARGVPLIHHNVFFSADYAAEFDDLFARRAVPADPTVYVCAQQRGNATDASAAAAPEGMLLLMNAPADGGEADAMPLPADALAHAQRRIAASGLELTSGATPAVVTRPADFAERFPGSGGALYGAAGHGWRAAFSRAGARSTLPGVYLAGGSVHPGAGVPMAALSGLQAADAILRDHGRG